MHTFILNSKEEFTMSGELFQTVAALVYLNRTTQHHSVIPIVLVRRHLDCGLKNAKDIVDYISEHLVVSIGKQVELSVPVPAVVYVAPGYPKLQDDNPDRYCYTEADGSCTSTDPRCMHQPRTDDIGRPWNPKANSAINEYLGTWKDPGHLVGKSDGENAD